MTVPPAALAIIRAALDDYLLTTRPSHATSDGQTAQIAQYLTSNGYTITPNNPENGHKRTPEHRMGPAKPLP